MKINSDRKMILVISSVAGLVLVLGIAVVIYATREPVAPPMAQKPAKPPVKTVKVPEQAANPGPTAVTPAPAPIAAGLDPYDPSSWGISLEKVPGLVVGQVTGYRITSVVASRLIAQASSTGQWNPVGDTIIALIDKNGVQHAINDLDKFRKLIKENGPNLTWVMKKPDGTAVDMKFIF